MNETEKYPNAKIPAVASSDGLGIREIFDDKQAAEYIGGVKARAVREWRALRGLPYIKISDKVMRIRKTELDAWLDSHKTVQTIREPKDA